jgi:hypothetical protein
MFYTAQTGRYLPVGPIIKGHAIQEQKEPTVRPETLVPTTNLHCVKSQEREDLISAMAKA